MPCDYSKYPKDWKQIRARILKRDGHRCRFCLVPNYSWRDTKSDAHFANKNEVYIHAVALASVQFGEHEDDKPFINSFIQSHSKIVLTIAHLNHDITDNRDINLAALCQRCHNRLDAPHRADNRKNKAEAPPS